MKRGAANTQHRITFSFSKSINTNYRLVIVFYIFYMYVNWTREYVVLIHTHTAEEKKMKWKEEMRKTTSDQHQQPSNLTTERMINAMKQQLSKSRTIFFAVIFKLAWLCFHFISFIINLSGKKFSFRTKTKIDIHIHT